MTEKHLELGEASLDKNRVNFGIMSEKGGGGAQEK